MILWYRCISQPHHGNQRPHGNLYPSPPTPPCQECPKAPPPATGNAITPILTDTNTCKVEINATTIPTAETDTTVPRTENHLPPLSPKWEVIRVCKVFPIHHFVGPTFPK
ncbi:unnamed protein product [Eretmochelys imbricata]